MKTLNSLQFIVSLIIILSFTSCTQETEFNLEKTQINNFEILPISNNKSSLYTENYKVSNETTYFDIANDVISLEVPVPANDYQPIRVYNISSENNAAILYLIGRNSTKDIKDSPINYIIKDEINISKIGLDTNLLENGNGLRIFVMNNIKEIDTDSSIYNCISDKVEYNILKDNNCSNSKSASADGPITRGDCIILM